MKAGQAGDASHLATCYPSPVGVEGRLFAGMTLRARRNSSSSRPRNFLRSSSLPQIRIEFVIAPAGHGACPAYPAGLRAPGADEGESACQRCGSTMAV